MTKPRNAGTIEATDTSEDLVPLVVVGAQIRPSRADVTSDQGLYRTKAGFYFPIC